VSENASLGLYGKAFSGAVVSALTAYSTAYSDGGGVTTSEWIGVAVATIGSFGLIWAVPNTPRAVAKYGKLLAAGFAALGSSLIVGLLDGSLSQPEVITAVIAFGLASGLTGTVSNAASSDPSDANGHLVAIPEAVKDSMVEGTTLVVRRGQEVALVDGDAAGDNIIANDPPLLS
jgi:hypothetical protein